MEQVWSDVNQVCSEAKQVCFDINQVCSVTNQVCFKTEQVCFDINQVWSDTKQVCIETEQVCSVIDQICFETKQACSKAEKAAFLSKIPFGGPEKGLSASVWVISGVFLPIFNSQQSGPVNFYTDTQSGMTNSFRFTHAGARDSRAAFATARMCASASGFGVPPSGGLLRAASCAFAFPDAGPAEAGSPNPICGHANASNTVSEAQMKRPAKMPPTHLIRSPA